MGAGVTEVDVRLDDGRALHAYDTVPEGGDDRLAVFWHHGTPNTGAPPAPLVAAAERLGLRWVSYDRPAYGGSTPHPGRSVGSAAGDVAAVADALGIDRFAVMGHSGGGPHALACAALLGERVVAVVAASALAPYGADGLDWFDGMTASGVAALQAALAGREAIERLAASGAEYDPEFTEADLAALRGEWAWMLEVVNAAMAGGPDGQIDDDLSYVRPWGFDVADVRCPVLLHHGARDRIAPVAHARWLAEHCPDAELRVFDDDGHVSVLTKSPEALEWLRTVAA
ncbi:MAG TPA: alpha/beta hydrolase [Acidimicrobiales bacterium]